MRTQNQNLEMSGANFTSPNQMSGPPLGGAGTPLGRPPPGGLGTAGPPQLGEGPPPPLTAAAPSVRPDGINKKNYRQPRNNHNIPPGVTNIRLNSANLAHNKVNHHHYAFI